tara:strand:- start:2218 stop:5700 length:3483 start_codon:yes stop_codon:yes gene_type:complete
MADQSPLSPGVYVSERELSFNAPSIGATTLATVGETLKGPAQQPIFIEDYNEYKTYFGGLDTTVFSGSTRLKYGQQYIAKNWLAESNSMWAVRSLGYSGYDAGTAWNISLNYVPTTNNVFRSFGGGGTDGHYNGLTQRELGGTGIPYMAPDGTISAMTLYKPTQYSFPNNAGATSVQPGMYSGGTWGYNADADGGSAINGTQYTNAGGGANFGANYQSAIELAVIFSATTYGGAGKLVVTGSTGGNSFAGPSSEAAGLPWVSELTTTSYPLCLLSATTLVITTNSSVGGADPTAFTAGGSEGFESPRITTGSNATTFPTIQWKPAISVHDNGVNASNVSPANIIHAGMGSRDVNPLGYPVTGHTFQLNWRYGNYIGAHSGGTTGWTAQTTGTVYTWSAATQEMVVGTLRSRAKYAGNTYSTNTAYNGGAWGVTDYQSPSFGNKSECDGTVTTCPEKPFRTINTTNYKEDFYISGYTNGASVNSQFLYKVSLDPNSQCYITKVLGTKKHNNSRHLWVEDIYPNTLLNLASSAVTFSNINLNKADTYRNYTETWQPLGALEGPTTPWIVSELMGSTLHKLFRVILIPDGNDANELVKISIQDVDVFTKTFTLTVREFNDSDASQRILEGYTNCSMNPTSQNYIGKKIGTENGEYPVRSRYIMLEIDENAPINALPSGFQGIVVRSYSGSTHSNEVYQDPPAQTEIANDSGWYGNESPKPFYNLTYNTTSDDIKKTYLGWSTKKGIDQNYFNYRGLETLTTTAPYKCGANGTLWTGRTKGFHFDKRVSGLTTSDVLQYEVGAYSFYTSGSTGTLVGDSGNYYQNKDYLKFTVIPYGGFDGWDEYRITRTNADTYIIGGTDYGTFWYNQSFTTSTCQVTDYYAYYDAMRKLANPEATPSSVFTTPGIDYTNNLTLVNRAKEMIENDKGDSIYIVTSDNPRNQTVDEAVDNLENAALNSSYMATYWPWVRYNDTENNVRIYIPPTANVVRNLALTDNVSFPWFATAGYNRGKLDVDRAQTKLTQINRDDLYEARINPIATFNGAGVIIWGNKTLQTTQSALDRINVRRLMLDLKTKVKDIGLQLLFEQNDAIVRQQFLSLINPVLEEVRANRGLTDFRVELNSDVNELDTNSMTGKIFVKPTRTLEFIEVEFNITPSSTSFTDLT